MGVIQGDFSNGTLSATDIACPTIGTLTIIFGTLTIRKIFDKVINKTLENLEVMKKKSEQEGELIQSSISQLDKAQVLLENSQETASAVVEIDRNINSINNGIQDLDIRVKSSVEILSDVTGSVEKIQRSITDQSLQISHSSSSIEQIVASIQSVGTIIGKEEESVELLKNKSENGETKISETKKAISHVTNQMDNIRSMTSMISKIAAQTNLLAMNAAIEAAHAGDSGLGFAVVAQEIRNLAESSSVNAKEIADKLKELISSIEKANESVNSTGVSFQEISSEIEVVSKAMGEIKSNSQELIYSGNDLLKTATSLTESTVEVSKQSKMLIKSHDEMHQDMQILVNVSSEMTGGITEISQGISMISSSIQEISALSEGLKNHGEQLNSQIFNFEELIEI